MKLKIRLPRKNARLVYTQIVLILVVFGLISLGLPSMVTYLTDIILVILFLKCLGKMQVSFIYTQSKHILYLIVSLIIFACIGAAMNLVNPLLFVWGARNNFRFYLFFIGCLVLLSTTDIDAIIGLFKKVFWLNIIVASVEYFILGYQNDLLGGIFGFQNGCNTYMNVYICIIVAVAFGEYITGKRNIRELMAYTVGTLYCATLSELKVFYAEILIIVVIALIIKRPSIKTFGLITAIVVGLMLGFQFLLRYNPESLTMFFDLDAMDYYLSGGGYTNSGDLNRFTAISQIYDMFFKDTWINKIFGFGLGSCDTSAYSFLQSEFFKHYEYLHYRWFTHAWVYLEQGAIGILLTFLFFIMIIIYTLYHKRDVARNDLLIITVLFISTTILGIIYNSSLQMESSYLIAFMCSIPFVAYKTQILME